MDVNELFRYIIMFGAYSINHVYLDIFLTYSNTDSMLLNLINWGLFGYKAILYPCNVLFLLISLEFTWSTRVSIISLGIFCAKLSNDARFVRDMVFDSFLQQ